MTRLPIPGEEQWGNLLNDYLLTSLADDGKLRENSVNLASIKAKQALAKPQDKLVLTNDGSDLAWESAAATLAATTQQITAQINVRDYGAVGDGKTDDTDAVQAAIDAAKEGGGVLFPDGRYMVRGLKIRKNGTTLIGTSRGGSRIVRHSGTEPLIDMCGTGTMDNHLKYCSITSIMISGNYLPGVLVRSYYSDNSIFTGVNFVHCVGTAVDFIEAWDSAFVNCAWENCGSTTQAAVLLRNTQPEGQFGFSRDNTNQIHFQNCRWESWRNGAVCLDGKANGSTALLNGIFFVACKMESRYAAGPALQIKEGTTIVFVNQLYIAMMSRDSGYTEPLDAIEDRGTHIFMSNLYVQWGTAVGLANSMVHIYRGSPHMYHEIGTYYPTEDPRVASFIAESAATVVMISCDWVNRGKRFEGNIDSMLEGGPMMGYTFPIDNMGSVRIVSHTTGKDMIKIDNNTSRPAFHALNGIDLVGFSDNYATEKWRIVGQNGTARFAQGKFQIEGTKGYLGINTTPFTGIAMLIRAAVEGDRGIAVVRPSSTATNRLMEFQDENYNIQGMSIDSNGRPVAVGTPAKVAPGAQVSYANPGIQVRDIAGNINCAVKPSPTAPGTIATVTFSRPYVSTPLAIHISDNSPVNANLFVSARSAAGFTVSTRNPLQGGAQISFDYTVIA